MTSIAPSSHPQSARREKTRLHIVVLIPVYDDWPAVRELIAILDQRIAECNVDLELLIVDDASSVPSSTEFQRLDLQTVCRIRVLELRRNLGHQRAIAVGLGHIEAHLPCDAVVVMDGDGEDLPQDVARLIEAHRLSTGGQRVIFAQRSQRSEGPLFSLFYGLYRTLFGALTGRRIQMGNFCLVPQDALHRIVAVSEIWTHYASGVIRARVPYTEISTHRGLRLRGQSKMNFSSLVMHGLSSIAVHADTVGIRLLVVSLLMGAAALAMAVVVLAIRLTTALAIPGWATTTLGLLALLMVQSMMASLFFSFIVLSSRNNYSFIPSRDHSYFILREATVWEKS